MNVIETAIEGVKIVEPNVFRDARGYFCETFHMTCEGEASWAEFAMEIFRLAGRSQRVVGCTTEEYPRPAPRPKNSRLEKRALREAGMPPMPDWKEALKEFLACC